MLRAPHRGRLAIALVVSLWAGLAPAEERPIVEITPGKARTYRAAVQRFADRTQSAVPERVEALRRSIEEGLRFTGVLLPLPEDAYLGSKDTESLVDGVRGDCGDWTQSGADALVEGVIRDAEGGVEVEIQVWDTARCAKLARSTLRAGPTRTGVERAGLRLSDAVVEALTGTRGCAATEIAFVSDRDGGRQVYVMNADGSDERRATNWRSIKAFPDWHPGGKAILYTAYGRDGEPALFLTSRGAGRPGKVLPSRLGNLSLYRGVFDPSGERLAIVAADGAGETGDAAEIFSVRRDGSRLRRLTNSGGIDVSPTWSPDGKRIAFVSDRSGSPQLYVMDADGGELRRLTYQGTYNTSPAWSPDGRWIAYETRLEAQFDIWITDPSGEVNVPVIEHPRSDESPTWSPDGRKLVFSSNRRGRADIYVTDLSGENMRRLTKNAGENISPAWGPFSE